MHKVKPKRIKVQRPVGGKRGAADAATEAVVRMPEDMVNELMLDITVDSDASDTESLKEAAPQSAGAAGEVEGMVDLEDLGSTMAASSAHVDSISRSLVSTDPASRPEMVTPLQRQSLTKEGYKIIGSHSAVKLCRWTKHQLRGRGGCYKHTFYGITSYQCMEATPSLACANKCVFCWRHHKNPVGREWRWRTDEPAAIVAEGVDKHVKMIHEFKGAKGVKPERLAEAYTVRHCALSLVGEPIMYPRINELIRELHKRRISSFLVTNAQFPDQIRNLEPVTQLYVSIDAATKDSLKAVDRPLFKDFWERFLECLRQLREKQQRTVYRLTLVKSWNMEEVDQYVKLLEIGQPDLIEIKAVTYCGTSDASSLTMSNVPWHHEVLAFAQAIADRHAKSVAALGGPAEGRYGIATEHAHSCCVLLARRDIYFSSPDDQPGAEPRWRTWINYDRFHELVDQYYQDGTRFTSADYLADTPSWAIYGAEERGFDPAEVRFRKNRKGVKVPLEYKASESGCG